MAGFFSWSWVHLEWRYGRVPCLELGVVHQNTRSVCQTSGLDHITPSLHGFRASYPRAGRSVGACHSRNHFSRMHLLPRVRSQSLVPSVVSGPTRKQRPFTAFVSQHGPYPVFSTPRGGVLVFFALGARVAANGHQAQSSQWDNVVALQEAGCVCGSLSLGVLPVCLRHHASKMS